MQQDFAETVAINGLGWLVSDEELMGVFMGASGVSVDELRTRATDPAFLISVLDFITMDDAWVVGFCDKFGYAYDIPLTARQALPGGAQTHWT